MQDVPVSIIIADDHPIVRKGLREILEEEQSFHIVGECGDGGAALECIRTLRPDVAILDIDMPVMTGQEVAMVVQRHRIDTAMVFLTISDSVEMFNRAMEHGVTGYVLKDAATDDLVRAVRVVLRGEYYFSPSLAYRAMTEKKAVAGAPALSTDLDALSPTERTVLRLVAEDRTSQEIADLLNISMRTVDSHRLHIARKLGLQGSYSLLRFALQNRDNL